MTPLFNNSGFTLIELLVVVLIIGILAAVALPQYQKAVEKSRAAQAISLVKSVHQAMHAYYLANGTYPNSFDELAIEIPWPVVANTNNSVYASNDWTVYIFKSDNGLAVAMLRKTGKYKGTGFFMPVTNMLGIQADRLYCAERTLTTSEDLFPTFDGQEGDYCQKIQKSAACVNTSGWLRLCPMP